LVDSLVFAEKLKKNGSRGLAQARVYYIAMDPKQSDPANTILIGESANYMDDDNHANNIHHIESNDAIEEEKKSIAMPQQSTPPPTPPLRLKADFDVHGNGNEVGNDEDGNNDDIHLDPLEKPVKVIKVALIGPVGVGKTSLLARFIDGNFIHHITPTNAFSGRATLMRIKVSFVSFTTSNLH
jgi:hypothetical protein